MCTEPMGTRARPRFECQYCNDACCLECAKTYALTQAEYSRRPRCMFQNCGREFTQEFVDANFPVSWRNTKMREVEVRDLASA